MQQANEYKKYLYAVGGGTAGHVYPAQALGKQGPNTTISAPQINGVKFAQFLVYNVLFHLLTEKVYFGHFFLPSSCIQILFGSINSDAVFVFGGYVTVVPAIVAWLKRIKPLLKPMPLKAELYLSNDLRVCLILVVLR